MHEKFKPNVVAGGVLTCALVLTHWPLLHDLGMYGAHDWDSMASTRHLVLRSVFDFGQFPFWDPYAGGGVPAWGSPEGGTIAFSPMLLVYRALPLWAAIRAEVILLAICGVWGMWVLAGKTTRDPSLRAFACVTGMLNTRWALQAASGHAWHLYYGLFPWCMVLGYDCVFAPHARTAGVVFRTAALLAFLVYCGGIYPLPHSVLALMLYIAVMSRALRTRVPLLRFAGAGILALFLAAPKLLPLVDTMRRFPRLVESRETIDPITYLRLFTARTSDRVSWPVPPLDYGYHEYGIYLGIGGMAVLLYGLFRVNRFRVEATSNEARAHRIALLTVGLGFLASSQLVGPWWLLHKLPMFSSQHVPMRFMYPAVMCMVCVSVAGLASLSSSVLRLAPLGVVAIALPIGLESRATLDSMFALRLPEHSSFRPFAQTRRGGVNYGPSQGRAALNGPSSLLPRLENQGVLDSMTFDMGGVRDREGHLLARAPFQGARGSDEPGYRGEAFVEGKGEVSIVFWSPNEVRLQVTGGDPGHTRVVLNQNWDAGWTSAGAPALEHENLVAADVGSGEATVTFCYRPRTFTLGCILAAIGLLLALMLVRAIAPARSTPLERAITRV
jgi:hypothetical protein